MAETARVLAAGAYGDVVGSVRPGSEIPARPDVDEPPLVMLTEDLFALLVHYFQDARINQVIVNVGGLVLEKFLPAFNFDDVLLATGGGEAEPVPAAVFLSQFSMFNVEGSILNDLGICHPFGRFWFGFWFGDWVDVDLRRGIDGRLINLGLGFDLEYLMTRVVLQAVEQAVYPASYPPGVGVHRPETAVAGLLVVVQPGSGAASFHADAVGIQVFVLNLV